MILPHQMLSMVVFSGADDPIPGLGETGMAPGSASLPSPATDSRR